ncbi:uncharacterized protein F4812DRAFT_462829 [Daldinia caldariorum]|uniref:uncharacterized protein n=1 Tax=Daldinia caldariorum TaxID=326644 RepID=UPI002007DE07|nr:uncharacterized protein F4812DRAFT_462829 [Daldinia caldariorum]KAI1464410.1 hypothetical protein F4812DRAFT_462829 [Daldinia caldariorum]
MSFLNVLIPVATLTSLVGDICKQIDAGRLEVTDAPSNKKPTAELTQLATLLEQKLNRKFKSHTLIKMDSLEDFYLDEVEGEKCIFCIRRNESGPAIWTDMVRECRIEENNITLIEEGYLHAEGDDGGIYFILWPLKEPEESDATQGPQGQRAKGELVASKAQYDPVDKALETNRVKEITTPEGGRRQWRLPASWERIRREAKRGKKRGSDLMADPTPGNTAEDYADFEEMVEELADIFAEEASKNTGPAAGNSIVQPNRPYGTREKARRQGINSEVIPVRQQSNKRHKIRKSM